MYQTESTLMLPNTPAISTVVTHIVFNDILTETLLPAYPIPLITGCGYEASSITQVPVPSVTAKFLLPALGLVLEVSPFSCASYLFAKYIHTCDFSFR